VQVTSKRLILLFLLIPFACLAQEDRSVDADIHDKSFHSLTMVMASAFIPNSFSDNTNDILVVPVYGLNYDYQINSKWGGGIHLDILLQQFKIEKHGSHEEIIRENPVSITAVIFFKPHDHWKIIGGYGIEAEKSESFQLIKFGIEYSLELHSSWELGFAFENNFKLNGYYTMLLGIGFTKKFS
jgi:hypothetical protein